MVCHKASITLIRRCTQRTLAKSILQQAELAEQLCDLTVVQNTCTGLPLVSVPELWVIASRMKGTLVVDWGQVWVCTGRAGKSGGRGAG